MKMNIALKSIMTMFVSLYLTANLTACAKKDDGNGGSAIDARARNSGAQTQPGNVGGYKANFWTYITPVGSVGASQFENIAKDFLSASWDREYVGSVTTQDVYLNGYIEFTNTNQINTATSRVMIVVADSFYRDGALMDGVKATPYTVQISGAASGTRNGNQFSVLFRDAYQEIQLQGTLSGASINGTVSFRNLKDFKNSNLKSAQPMGEFAIQSCALINCTL